MSDWQDEPCTDRQIEFAKSLGVSIDSAGTTKGEASRLIDNALTINKRKTDSGLPTDRQLQESHDLGIDVRNGMTYGELEGLIRAARDRLPTTWQEELCRRLNVTINPKMSRQQIDIWLDKARKSPKFSDRFKRIEIEDKKEAERAQREYESELREQYGDLVDELLKWEKLCNSSEPHVLIFKRGKKVVVDIVELDMAEIEDAKRPYVNVFCQFPKKMREPDCDPWMEWETEKTIRADKVLHVEPFSEKFRVEKIGGMEWRTTIDDADYYEDVISELSAFAEKLGQT